MPEVYLAGGDTMQSVDDPDWQGQTFLVLENTMLQFIDLEMRGSMRINQPVIQIFNRDAHHKPWGPCLSRNMWITEQKASFFTTGRVRFKMESLLLGTEQWYVIIVQNYPGLLGNSASWQYDKDDGAYPRGLRISSPDSGATWTIHYNDDFMFAVFGDPPLPKPDPPPPIDYFATLACLFIPTAISINFTLTTSVPCHLWCYYTDKKPLRHRAARIVRGLLVPWGAYFCFVAWKKVEQTELGDTFSHTFEMPPWAICVTRYFTFRGEVDNIQSPSVGPIFKKHHQRTEDTLTLRPNAPGHRCGISRQTGAPCPNHYLNVNEIIPDEHTSTVQEESKPGYSLDLYNIDDPPELNAFIEELTVVTRCKANAIATWPSLHIIIYTDGKYYDKFGQFDPALVNPWNAAAFYVYTNWFDFKATWPLNPATGNPWTWQNIKDLQIGIALRYPLAFRIPPPRFTYCTQVYLNVKYQTLVE